MNMVIGTYSSVRKKNFFCKFSFYKFKIHFYALLKFYIAFWTPFVIWNHYRFLNLKLRFKQCISTDIIIYRGLNQVSNNINIDNNSHEVYTPPIFIRICKKKYNILDLIVYTVVAAYIELTLGPEYLSPFLINQWI